MNLQKFRVFLSDTKNSLELSYLKKCEVEKFRDKRRIAIANEYPLTEEQKEQIDNLYLSNYGEKIDYVWHQNYAAHAGKFDYRYFPEHLYIPEFERYLNHNRSAVAMFSDKNHIALLAKGVGVRTPRTIVKCTNGFLCDEDNNRITPLMATELVKRQGACFVKPTVNSNSGRNCAKLSEGDFFSFDTMAMVVSGGGYKRDFVVQELIACHETIRTIYPNSVNTLRVITYVWKGEIEVMPIIIRIGKGGSYVDNAHAGGIFCAVNNDGTMGGHAITEFNNQFYEHPDTHIVFKNHRISNIDKVIETAKRMHCAIPQLGAFNWDFTIDTEGEPVLIEANCANGSIWLPQMAHGKGAFGNLTAEVLQWLRYMKKLRPHERNRLPGGMMG